jgi:hypothetical protein
MIRRSRRVRSRRTRKAESRGHCHQIGERVSLHLSHHLTSVGLYRDLADVELATDLFIQQAGGYQGHDLPFARRERRVTVPERPYLRLATKCGLAGLDEFRAGGMDQDFWSDGWPCSEMSSAKSRRANKQLDSGMYSGVDTSYGAKQQFHNSSFRGFGQGDGAESRLDSTL